MRKSVNLSGLSFEILRVHWSAAQWETSELRIEPEVSKTKRARIVLFSPSPCLVWLKHGFWSITNRKAHSRRWRIASQTVSSTLTRAYRLQFDSTIVHGAYGVVVRCNISSTASRY
jgi:hypothetical protein